MKDNYLSADGIRTLPERNVVTKLPWSKGNIEERMLASNQQQRRQTLMSLESLQSSLPTLLTHSPQMKTQGVKQTYFM